MADSSDAPLSLKTLIVRGLRFHRRTHLAVAAAVAAAGAVLTGALVVGDSMRGSLRHLLLDQLGRIDEVLVTDRFFRTQLADELEHHQDFSKYYAQAVPAIYLPGTVENPRGDGNLRSGSVTILGSDERFWSFASGGPPAPPAQNEIVLNAPLAGEIGAKPGDDVLLRIGSESQIPPDSALGRKTETVRTRRLRVSAVIAAEGLGRFSLFPNQQLPLNAYVATSTLQDILEKPDRVNAIFVAAKDDAVDRQVAHDALEHCLQPSLADYGLQLEMHRLGYAQWTSDRMLLDPPAVRAIHKTYAERRPQDLFTYLANTIASGDQNIPYSTITAIDFVEEPPLGPFRSLDGMPIGRLNEGEIVLNTWAADELGVDPGADIEISYFEPESTHGEVREGKAKFKLKNIVQIEGLAADPDLTPRLPGVTDRVTIGDWDAPFPFDPARVRKVDEKYWDEYRTTPKAFVSLATGRKLWSSRFGDTTAVRLVPPEGATVSSLEALLKFDPADFGFKFLALKQMGMTAARGTTSFDGLFLGFSFFIMVSALLLVALLFRMGVDERAEEVGVMMAVGIPPWKIATVLGGEGLAVCTAGSLLGVVAGVFYAWLMLVGLSTWWLGAIRVSFLRLYFTPTSLAIGLISTILVSMATIAWVLWRLEYVSIRRLLARETANDRWPTGGGSLRSRLVAGGLIVVAVALGGTAPWLPGEAAAGAFVAAGSLVLAAALIMIWSILRRGATAPVGVGRMPIARLALRSGARNPTRSTLTIGLVAAASFLIVALSAFRLDPAAESRGRDSGSGGFDLVAQSDQPIYQNLDTAKGRDELGFSTEANKALDKVSIIPMRLRRGDDASCLNLYQSTRPRVLGVPQTMIARGGFMWGHTMADSAHEEENPWRLLDRDLGRTSDGAVLLPAVLDFNTATYSLHKRLGQYIILEGTNIRFQIVGLLKNSIFQGDVLCSEREFVKNFPLTSGYRFFLIDSDGQPLAKVRETLEGALGDYGFDATSSQERLAGFFAVQNTYLSTFQSLGGLGLLLGTVALATVQLRSVLQRRGELALLRATGFRSALLARMVMVENGLLLMAGLGVGVAAALVAVLPHWLSGGASVPWLSLSATLTLVMLVGLAAGLLAVRTTLRLPLLAALREE